MQPTDRVASTAVAAAIAVIATIAAGVVAAATTAFAQTAAALAPPKRTTSVSDTAAAATFVDESGCGTCYEAASHAWTGSQHDLAMQDATERTVLGDFEDARFTYAA